LSCAPILTFLPVCRAAFRQAIQAVGRASRAHHLCSPLPIFAITSASQVRAYRHLQRGPTGVHDLRMQPSGKQPERYQRCIQHEMLPHRQCPNSTIADELCYKHLMSCALLLLIPRKPDAGSVKKQLLNLHVEAVLF
jgi:hypothetical protein